MLAALLLGAVAVLVPGVAGVIVVSLAGVFALTLATRYLFADSEAMTKRVLVWSVAGVVLHLAIGLLSEVVGANVLFGFDDYTYQDQARSITEHWERGTPIAVIEQGKEGFPYLLAVFYWLFGIFKPVGLAINAVIAAALVPVVTDLTRRMFDDSAARYVAPIVLFVPGLLIWTSHLLREAGVLLLIAIGANAAFRVAQRFQIVPTVVFVLSMGALLTFRGYVGFVLAGTFILGVVVGSRNLVAGLSFQVATLSLLVVVVLGAGLGYAGVVRTLGGGLQELTVLREAVAASAESSFARDVDVSSPAKVIAYLPSGFVNTMFGPFPWQVRSVRQAPGLVEAIVWWYLLVHLAIGIRVGWRRIGRSTLILLLPTAVLSVVLSVLVTNFGLALRERLQILVLLTPLIALGLARRRARRQAEAA